MPGFLHKDTLSPQIWETFHCLSCVLTAIWLDYSQLCMYISHTHIYHLTSLQLSYIIHYWDRDCGNSKFLCKRGLRQVWHSCRITAPKKMQFFVGGDNAGVALGALMQQLGLVMSVTHPVTHNSNTACIWKPGCLSK